MVDVPGQTAHGSERQSDGALFSPRQQSEPDKEPNRKDREAEERDFLQHAGPGQRESSLRQHGFVLLSR
jgi:hypothetical protein